MGLQLAARSHFFNLICIVRNYTIMSAVSHIAILFFLRAARKPTHSNGCGLLPKKSLDGQALNFPPSPHYSVPRLMNLGFAFPFCFEFSAFLGKNHFLIIHILPWKFDKFLCWENNCLCNLVCKKPSSSSGPGAYTPDAPQPIGLLCYPSSPPP
jgi:hypothetical protein